MAIWPENWSAVMVFTRLASQWRIAVGLGGGHYLGLDYAGVLAALHLLRLDPETWPDLFWRLQVLESAACQALNEKSVKRG